MRVKAITVDLDRTLLHTDKSISTYTAAVLRKCKENGISIVVATARPLYAIRHYLEIIDFNAIVVSNGARVICGGQRKEYGICHKSAEHILESLKAYPELRITLDTGDCPYSNKQIADYESIICDDLLVPLKREGALKIIVSFDNEATLDIVESVLTDDLYYTIANGHLIQIMNKTATKWNGIKAVLEIISCSPDEAVYFGDDYDDIEPIKMCGMGVAVANGIKEVKAVADYVADSNDEDGVARFIEQELGI